MRWNTMQGDIPRVCALGDLLMGAAMADLQYDDGEYVAVASTLIKVLGVAELPMPVQEHLKAFEPQGFDVAAALRTLALEPREHKDLLKVIAKVIHADEVVHDAERQYLDKVGAALGMTDEDVKKALA